MKQEKLLVEAARRAARYLNAVETRRVFPLPEDIARLYALGGAFPEGPSDAEAVLGLLDDVGSPATVTNANGRYFGFVNGGTLPAALAANWLAGAWDENSSFWVMSPVSSKVEEIAGGWLREIFGLDSSCGVGFVTGATMANVSGLAAARDALLKRTGWDVEEQGLVGAPEIKVIVGAEVHVALKKALGLLGLGRARVVSGPVDKQGRMRGDAMPELDERTIVCMQSGNVNTGAFDPAAEICARAHQAGAWGHGDGAFGLWAAAAPALAHLMKGVAAASAWG